MKTVSKLLTMTFIVAVIASCGGGDDISGKKAKLEKLKAQQIEVADQIKALEQEIAHGGDTTSASTEKMKDVLVTKTEPVLFQHRIDVQGRVEGDENITIAVKMPGTLVKVNVVAGSTVTAGQVMAEIESGAMKAQLTELKNSYELTKDIYNKQKNLWDQKVGTEMQYLQAKNAKESMEQRIKQLTETWDMYNIKAPFNGTVDEVFVKLGQTVAPGMPAIRIVNLRNLKVRADLAEAYAANVKSGQPVNIVFPDINKTIESRVTYNGKVINPLTRTFTVDIALPSDESYRPNMVAQVGIVDYTTKEAMVVPVNTVQNIEGKNYVYVSAVENGKKVARKREVVVGGTYNGIAEIKSGLHAGELVITTGYGNLNDGELIRY